MWALSKTNNCEGGNYLFEDISREAGSCSPGQLPGLNRHSAHQQFQSARLGNGLADPVPERQYCDWRYRQLVDSDCQKSFQQGQIRPQFPADAYPDACFMRSVRSD